MDIEILRSDERYRIANMTDKEAVDILKGFLKHSQFMMGRGNGKRIETLTLKLIRAISKGIEALEERNDKK